MVCTKSPIGLRRRTAALCVAWAVARQFDDFGQLGFALDQREQAAFVSSTDNGIALPVSQTGFARRWSDARKCRFYRGSDHVRRSCRRACYSVFRAVGDCAKVAAVACVLPDHLVDALLSLMPCSNSQPLICCGDQRFRRNFASIFAPQRRCRLAGPTPYRLSCLSLRLSLLEPIAALTSITAHLSAHCVGMYTRGKRECERSSSSYLARKSLSIHLRKPAIVSQALSSRTASRAGR